MTEQDFGRARNALTRDPEPLGSWPDLVDRAAEKLAHASVLAMSDTEADKRRVMRVLAQISGALTAVSLKMIELEGAEHETPTTNALFDKIVAAMGLDPEDPPRVDQAIRMIEGFVRGYHQDQVEGQPGLALRNGDGVTVHFQRNGVIVRKLVDATVYRSGPDSEPELIVIADDERDKIIVGQRHIPVHIIEGGGRTDRSLEGTLIVDITQDGDPLIIEVDAR